ncbi:NADP-dependent oxidoreductase [Rhizobium sp. NFR03]|uniref:NADP-dependent oxidoreductase n=1 Tax=Rhizobium sp. NFR03 TaxID=1566263 RepID=UPI0008C5E02D|nr:NADP-dependent oxidoreductase [Rhizobium sp. NFR03]SES45500.1 NADPH:quinone reductase [Rhizobium sp. NFR03]
MRQIILSDYGQNPVLTDVAMPEPKDGEVLVLIAAAALNPLDVKLQRGEVHAYFPLTFPSMMGTDLAGTVEKVGSLTSRWRIGDRVMARLDPTKGGAFAEYAIVPEDQLVIVPQDMNFNSASGLPTAAGTAWQALVEMADVKAGQTVLVHAGSGGVGSFAIQFARSFGARVIATASGNGVEIARELGADQVIDYRSEDFTENISDVDVVLDTVGGDTQQRSFNVLRSAGKLVSTVSPPDQAFATAHKVEGGFVFHTSNAGRLSNLAKAMREKGHSVLIDSVFPIASFAEAFERQASGRARGKIIVTF